MSHRIELPADLLSLIEKREQADRRQADEAAPTDQAETTPAGEERRQTVRRAEERPDS
jgi:hypothetical protein